MRSGRRSVSLVVVVVTGATTLFASRAWPIAIGVDFGVGVPLSAQTAFLHAKDAIWEPLLLPSYAAEEIMVKVEWNSTGMNGLAASWAPLRKDFGSTDPDYQAGTYYTSALANHLKQGDVDATIVYDIKITFDGTDPWYYGTDAQTPLDKFDFVTIAAHEIGHGLGFWETVEESGSFWNSTPAIFDRFLEWDNGDGDFLALTDMIDSDRALAITSDNLYWSGSHGTAANGGTFIKIYAPSQYDLGSSVSHLDINAFPNDLMKYAFSEKEAIHAPSAQDLGMLVDMGWDVVPEPGTFVLFGTGVVVLAGWRRRTKGALD